MKPKLDASTAAMAAKIDLVIERAPDLIAAGITSLSIDGLAVTLSAPPPEPSATEAPTAAPVHSDPLMDGATFPGGAVPGFKLDKDFE